MSLIEDALKRARDEAARQEEAHRSGKRPWIAPAPRKRASRLGAAAVFAAVAVAAAVATTFRVLRPRPSGPAAARATPASLGRAPAPSAAVPLPPVRESVEVPPPPGAAKAPAPVESEARASTPPAAKEPAGKPPAAPAPAAPPATARPSAAPPVRPPASSSLRDGRTFVRVAELPSGEKIELEGIVYSDTNPVAVIGGSVLAPGAYVGDFQIVRIEESRVTLHGNGVTIYLTLF